MLLYKIVTYVFLNVNFSACKIAKDSDLSFTYFPWPLTFEDYLIGKNYIIFKIVYFPNYLRLY